MRMPGASPPTAGRSANGGLLDLLLDHVGCGKELILSLISTVFRLLEKIILTEFFMPRVCPKRCKGAHGGGGAKSDFFGGVLIRLCACARRRAVCISEVQDSISESVRRLLIDKITKLGLGASFSVLDSEIRGQARTSSSRACSPATP